MVDDGTGREGSDGGSQTVGHQHEEALPGRAYLGRTDLIDIQTATDVEEIEGHTIDEAAEDEEDDAGVVGRTESEESETEHPSEHGDEHDDLDAEAFQEEGDEQDAQGFCHLREAHEHRSVVGTESICHLRNGLERGDVGSREAVGDLQGHAQHGTEEEEQRRLPVLEETERIEPQARCQ